MAVSKGVLSFLCVVVCLIICRLPYFNENLLHISGLEYRPIVFGEEFCSSIYDDKVILLSTYFEKLVNIVSVKKLFHAELGDKKIIIKHLFPADTLENVQQEFDSIFDDKVLQSPNAFDIIKLYIHSIINFKHGTSLTSKVRLCPYSSSVTIDNFFMKVVDPSFKVSDYFHTWTILKCNPEPLILKLLQPPEWPVPEFYGSCGHLIAVEDCGVMLTNHYNSPWIVRANLSYQILTAALQFTFDDPDFAYYFTDLSPDNFAVDHEGRLKLIDLEHVILVDKKPVFEDDEQPKWMYNHSSKHYPCEDCIIFESDEICSHKVSDHNIYAACKELLAHTSLMPGGLLHNAPEGFSQSEHMYFLIMDCVEGHARDRFSTVQQLISILKDVL